MTYFDLARRPSGCLCGRPLPPVAGGGTGSAPRLCIIAAVVFGLLPIGVGCGQLPPSRPRPLLRRELAEAVFDGAQAREFKAEPNSFAVISTMGMTRSYAMRVGPMTPSTPTTSWSIVYGAATILQSSSMV